MPEEKSSKEENACHSVIKGTFFRKSLFFSHAVSVPVHYLNIKAFRLSNHGKLNFVVGLLILCIRFSVEFTAGVTVDLPGHLVVEWNFVGLEAGLKVVSDCFFIETAVYGNDRWS